MAGASAILTLWLTLWEVTAHQRKIPSEQQTVNKPFWGLSVTDPMGKSPQRGSEDHEVVEFGGPKTLHCIP